MGVERLCAMRWKRIFRPSRGLRDPRSQSRASAPDYKQGPRSRDRNACKVTRNDDVDRGRTAPSMERTNIAHRALARTRESLMPKFPYQALDARNQSTTGHLPAASLKPATEQLTNLGYVPPPTRPAAAGQ